MKPTILDSKTKLDFNDILLEPSRVTSIRSRSQIDIKDDNGMLPIFAAPMDTVVGANNKRLFVNKNINVCLPRGVKSDYPSMFESYSLEEFRDKFIRPNKEVNVNHKHRVLIDMANGHMGDLVNTVKEAKEKFNNMTLMVGNVANPETYKELSEAGADYIRVGIGNGGGCLTTQQTGVGYPMASLIVECSLVSARLDNPAKIVADGGMKTYSDVVKALGLGADYVMLGSMLNKTIESCGDNYIFKRIKVSQRLAHFLYDNGFTIYKRFRGMSTKEVQKKWGNTTLKTSEGVVRIRKVEYTLRGFISNLGDYLKSAMSYSDAKDMDEFRYKSKFNIISNNAYKRFNK